MRKLFHFSDAFGFQSTEINVPKIIDRTLSCSRADFDLFFIPPKNATAIGDDFYCYDNVLISLDSLPMMIDGDIWW